MGAVIEVKYFNTFLLKKINAPNAVPAYDGSRGIPEDIGGYERLTSIGTNPWVIEESRIRGGYNNTTVDFGVRAYATSEEPNGSNRINALIYSGIFNSRTGINQTNVFSVGENITKSIDPVHGSIQRLYAEDTNLNIFQESKVSRALIDKDAIYSAEGGGSITSSNLVIGQIVPYTGEFGISKNPESFAVYGYRKYFTDKERNAVLRLSGNGIQEISNYGMSDFFRDDFNSIDTSVGPGRLVGGWDIHNKQYVLSIQPNIISTSNKFNTLSFDDNVNGWVSFFSYKPDWILSLRNNTYTLKDNKLYQHYSPVVDRNSFYSQDPVQSTITFVFNPSVSKNKVFSTINYEGDNGWEVLSISSDNTGKDYINGQNVFTSDSASKIYSYREGEYIINPANGLGVLRADYQTVFGTPNPGYNRLHAGFDRKNNKYVASIVNKSTEAEGEVRFGPSITGLKGFFLTVKMATDLTTDVGGAKELFAVSSNYTSTNGY